jgi:hypothetical protein
MSFRTYLARKVIKAAGLLVLVAIGASSLYGSLRDPIMEEPCEQGDCYLQRQS